MNDKKILVYRNILLPVSETFIVNQTMRLPSLKAYFLGVKLARPPRIEVAKERTRLINDGGKRGFLREVLFKIFGWIPKDILFWAKQVKPLLMVSHFGVDGSVALPLVKELEVPYIVHLHGFDVTLEDDYVLKNSTPLHKMYIIRRRSLAITARAFIVPSHFLRTKAIQRGFPEDKIHVVPHGVDFALFDIKNSDPKWGEILYVGRLVERKGLHFLIEALGLLRESYPAIRLTVIGDGPSRTFFENLAKGKLGERVQFLGAQPPQIIYEYLRKAYLFSMPSIVMPNGEAETFGVVFAEAHAMGVPVVSFASGGISEVVLHEKTGFLAPEGDVRALATSIELLLKDTYLRDQMGRAARAHCEESFDLRKNNEQLEKIYEKYIMEYTPK